jgi:hypothetical protein
VAKKESTYRRQAAALRSAGLLTVDLRSSFSPQKKGWITRKYNEVKHFLEGDFAAVKVKAKTDTGDRPRVKNTAFVAREGANKITLRRGMLVKEMTTPRGRVKKRILEPLAARPESIEAGIKRASRAGKAKKGKRRYVMVRRANAAGRGGGPQMENPADSLAYLQVTRQRIIDTEVLRLQTKFGLGKRAATKQAKQNAEDVISTWFVVEYEEDAEE